MAEVKEFPFPSTTEAWHSSPYDSILPTLAELSQAGKSVVITGGSAGIGLSIFQSFSLAGASKIAIISRRTTVLKKAAASNQDLVGDKTQVFVIFADVGNKEQVGEKDKLAKHLPRSAPHLAATARHSHQ